MGVAEGGRPSSLQVSVPLGQGGQGPRAGSGPGPAVSGVRVKAPAEGTRDHGMGSQADGRPWVRLEAGEGYASEEMKAQRMSAPWHVFSKSGVRAAGEPRRTGEVPNRAPCVLATSWSRAAFLAGGGGVAGRRWAPQRPLPQERHAPMHMHPRVPREPAQPPTRPLGEGLLSTSPACSTKEEEALRGAEEAPG